MNDVLRFKCLLYEFLFAEVDKYESAVQHAREVMIKSDFDSYYVLKYYEACCRYEDFNIFFSKVGAIIKEFSV